MTHETWIRLWCPEKMEPRKMWLKIGEIVESFDMHLCRYQYLVGKGDKDIELDGDAVNWEAIFDWTYAHSNGLLFHALVTYPDLETGEQIEWAYLHLVNSKGGLPLHQVKELPLEPGWLIELGFSQSAIEELGREFFERVVIASSKALFLEFEGIYGVAGVDFDHPEMIYVCLEFIKLMKEKELKSIPMFSSRDEPMRSPIWFYLLNEERYEASKPYFSSLPIERVEELPNGGALVLVNYPEFDDNCCHVE